MTTPDYDTDFYAWTQAQARALQAKDWPALDLDHLAEEIIDLGSNHRHAIESQMERLLHHLLKWCYDPARDPRRGWQLSMRHARREIAKLIDESPSLRDHPARYLTTAYRHARGDAAIDTGLPFATFPEACPWSVERVLEEDFWPDEQYDIRQT